MTIFMLVMTLMSGVGTWLAFTHDDPAFGVLGVVVTLACLACAVHEGTRARR